MRLIPLLALAVLATACGSYDPARVAPVKPKLIAFKPRPIALEPKPIDENQARRVEAGARSQWLRDLRATARRNPEQPFRSPGTAVLMHRLAREAAAHHFDVVSVRMVRVRQRAPLIVVRTKDSLSLAHAGASILIALDSDWSPRSDYEGFYLTAVDEKGVPLFLVWNIIGDRFPHLFEGSEWARSEALYPLPRFSRPYIRSPRR
jgi:hypothetical protein